MKKTNPFAKLLLLVCFLFLLMTSTTIVAQITFTSNGLGTWIPPTGVKAALVECWGGGGGGGRMVNLGGLGNGFGAGGGGGGAYAGSVVSLSESAVQYYVGRGGYGNTGVGLGFSQGFGESGQNTYWNNNQIKAAGGSGGGNLNGFFQMAGAGGAGGSSENSIGTRRFSGGNGSDGLAGGNGGGAGGGAGNQANGSTATSTMIGAQGGILGGGIGGYGGLYISISGSIGYGIFGLPNGGGGGGGSAFDSRYNNPVPYEGGTGSDGKIIVTYPTITGLSASSGCGAASLTITGTNLNTAIGTPTVTIGGIAVTSVTFQSATSLVVVPAVGSSGIVSVTSDYGTFEAATFMYAAIALPTVGSIASANTVCEGTSVTLTGTGANSYSWTGLGVTNGVPFTPPLGTSNYTVTGTNTNTGCSATATQTITVTPSTSSTQSVTANVSYFWSATNTIYTSSGIYTYSAPNSCNTQNLNLTINPIATVTTQPQSTVICSTVGSTAIFSAASTMQNATYAWQYRIVTKVNPNPDWITITSANAGAVYTNYTTATLGVTKTATLPAVGTQYRVVISGDFPSVTSNSAGLVIVSTTKAGTIAVASNVCLGNDLTFTLSGYVGTSLQWQSAPLSTATVPGVFTNIPGATAPAYTLTNAQLNSNKSYRVVVTNSCDGTSATTAVKTITVNPTTVTGVVTGGGTVCTGGSGTLKIVGNVGSVQWEYSTDEGVTYFSAPKAAALLVGLPFSTTSTSSTSTSYTVTNITAPIQFRARVTSGACLAGYTNTKTFELGTAATVGTVTAAISTICPGTSTTLNLNAATGVITWQKSTNYLAITPTWTNITNSNALSLWTGNLTTTTAFRASVSIGSCSTLLSNVQVVTVVLNPVAKSITGSSTAPSGTSVTTPLCTSNTSKVLTIGSGFIGSIQWQTLVTTASTATFVDVPGATGQSYTVTNPQDGPNYFRAKFSNSCGVEVTGAVFTVYYQSCAFKTAVKVPLDVIAYPNPYKDIFNLNFITSSNEKVGIRVYDMTGRLIESNWVTPAEVNDISIGVTYPAGVYNIVVTQDEEVKTLRVIKR